MIPHFHSRDEILLHAQGLTTSRACQRAFHHDVTFYGRFSRILPTYDDGGWMFRVTSKHGKTWILAMVRDPKDPRSLQVIERERIPWFYWEDGTGDQPKLYSFLKSVSHEGGFIEVDHSEDLRTADQRARDRRARERYLASDPGHGVSLDEDGPATVGEEAP